MNSEDTSSKAKEDGERVVRASSAETKSAVIESESVSLNPNPENQLADISAESTTADNELIQSRNADGEEISKVEEEMSAGSQSALPVGDSMNTKKKSDPYAILHSKTRRSFLVAGLAALSSIGAWKWIFSRSENFGLPWPIRNALEGTGKLMQTVFPPVRLAPEFTPIVGRPARTNGVIGITNSDVSAIQIENGLGDSTQKLTSIRIDDIRLLEKIDQTIEFKCIEGWSEIMSFSGTRFSDFLDHFQLGKRPDNQFFPYVGLETPDGEYYVSIDMESMLHPQTILAYEMNGSPLTEKHGSPLRLCIAVKYGIKNLKQIGKIRFANERPPDYWHEQGYDWYSSL